MFALGDRDTGATGITRNDRAGRGTSPGAPPTCWLGTGAATELTTARSEQKRLSKAVAMAGDVLELIGELKKRTALIQNLEAGTLGEADGGLHNQHRRDKPIPQF